MEEAGHEDDSPTQLLRVLSAVEEQMRTDSSSSLLVSLASFCSLLTSSLPQRKDCVQQQDVEIASLLSVLHRLLVRGIPLTLTSGHVQTSVAAPAPVDRVASAHWHSPFASSTSLFAAPAASTPHRSASSTLSFVSTHSVPSPSPFPPSTPRTAPHGSRAKVSGQDEQIRLLALSCLTLLALHRARVFQQHWSPFLPADASSSLSPRPFSGPHLLTVILFDPSSEVRTAAALLLTHLLPHSPLSKPLPPNLGRAAGSLTTRNADIIRGLHVGLLEAMKREQQADAQLAVVKAVTVLAGHIPYDQQPSGLLTPLVTHLIDDLLPVATSSARPPSRPSSRLSSGPPSPSSSSIPRAFSSSTELKPAVFAALAAIFSRALAELDELLTRRATFVPLLVSLAASRTPSDSPIDAWLLLSKLARHYPSHLLPHWKVDQSPSSSLYSLVLFALSSSSDPTARLLALRLMEEWTRLDASELTGGEDGGPEDEDDREAGGVREPVDGRLWEMEGVLELYGVHLPSLYRASGSGAGAGVRAKVIVLFGFIPYSSWSLLPSQQAAAVLECVTAAARDEAAAVRTAACHCVSLYAVYAARGEGGFVEKAVSLLTHLLSSEETVVAVRARAAWAVANLCDSASSSTAPPWHSHTSAHAFTLLLTTTLVTCEGNEKVVAHAVRAVGNVGRWCEASDGDHLWPHMQADVVRVLEGGRSAKVRWNAAYAAGNLLRNSAAHACTLVPPLLATLRQHLLPSPSSAPTSSPPNFKVSINAAMALACPPTRTAYSSLFCAMVRAALDCVVGCEVLVLKDWREVGYREALQAQLTVALCHVLSMLAEEEGEEEDVKVAVREGGWEVVSKAVLKERLRADGERSRARLSSATKRAAAAVVGTTTAAASSSTSLPRPSSSLLDTVVRRVSVLLPPDTRTRFLAAADGV